MFRNITVYLVLGLTLAALVGCGGGPGRPSSDPGKAREALKQVLDGWKAGGTLEAFQQANPDLKAVERQWKTGAKLLDYEIVGDGEPRGYDVQLTAKLTVQDQTGKQRAEKAVYSVSTHPNLVVLRTEPGG